MSRFIECVDYCLEFHVSIIRPNDQDKTDNRTEERNITMTTIS